MTEDGIQPIPLTPVGPWMAEAKCASVEDPDIFFPPNGSKGTRARQICAECEFTDRRPTLVPLTC